ncbi:MAG: hypothetical protein WAK29_18415, partial [Terriglobales bacterium]
NVLLEQDTRPYQGLMDKVMARDFRLDAGELEQAADLLSSKKGRLKDEIAAQPEVQSKLALERKLALLQRVLDRVNEACVMF